MPVIQITSIDVIFPPFTAFFSVKASSFP